jgi:hypothetical protein
MTSSTQTNPTPQSVLLVFGKPTSADLPQASWFHIEDRARVIASAQSLKFSAVDVQTAEDSSLLDGVHEGVLKGTGRMIVGSVTPEVYQRIEEYAAKATPAPVATVESEESEGAETALEQNKNKTAAGAAGSPAAPNSNVSPNISTQAWKNLKPGDHVLAAYFNLEKEAEGWWPAVVARVEKTQIVLNWPDAPHYPAIKRPPRHVAILHPDFIASGE